MEFHIKMTGSTPDIDAIERALHAVDPAALVDVDGTNLRVSAWLNAAQLLLLINQVGYPVEQAQLSQVPSTCCGGCSG